jgi:caa(3)-type oxidase subunit IV
MDEASRRKEHFQDEHVTSLHPNYMGVFWWLVALTILELIFGSLPTGPTYPYFAKVFLLVSMAVSKAALVALYFMHLKFEVRTLGIIALTPMILCGSSLHADAGLDPHERSPRRAGHTTHGELRPSAGLARSHLVIVAWRGRLRRCAAALGAAVPVRCRLRARRTQRPCDSRHLDGRPVDFIFTRARVPVAPAHGRFGQLRERGLGPDWCRSASTLARYPDVLRAMPRFAPTTDGSSPASAPLTA